MPNRSERKQPHDVDMSPEAVARRLETVQSLYELMVDLRGARVIGRVRDRKTRES